MLRSAKTKTWLSDQEGVWREIDEVALDRALTDEYLSIMDKKPVLMSGIDFMDREIDTPPYLIEPFLPMGGLALLHGKRGIGKSFLGTTIMEAVCKGEPLFGIFPTVQSRVCYVQLDMTDAVFQDRLKQAGDYYRFEGWDVLTGVANMMKANRKTEWVQKVHQNRPGLIIIDTLRKAHKWAENESDTPSKFLTKMRELFGAITIILIHHDKKSPAEGIVNQDEMFRGSGAWLDDMDLGLHVIKKPDGIWVDFSKVRTCPDIEPIAVKIDVQTMSLVALDGVAISEASRARAVARTYHRKQTKLGNKPTPSSIYKHLVLLGFGKSTASRAKEAVF